MRLTVAALVLLADVALAQGVLMVGNPATVPAQPPLVSLNAAAFIADDMVPVRHFADNPWPSGYGTRGGSNLAVGTARANLLVTERNWTIGAIYRQDWLLLTNADTVDAYAQSQSGQLAQQARSYALNYELSGFTADGLRVGYNWVAADAGNGRLVIGIAGNLLRGRSLRLDKVNGRLTSNAGSARLTASRDLIDTGMKAKSIDEADGFSDFSPAQAMAVPMGRGGSFDLGLHYTADNGARLGFAVNDIGGRITWNQVPRMRLTIADAQVNCVGADCTASRVGADWNSTYETVTLRLSPRYLVESAWPSAWATLRARVESTEGQYFPGFGFDYDLTPAWRLGIDYETRFRSLGMAVRNGHFYLAVRSDRVSVDASRVFGIGCGLYANF